MKTISKLILYVQMKEYAMADYEDDCTGEVRKHTFNSHKQK